MNDRKLKDEIERITDRFDKPYEEVEKELTELCDKHGMLQTATIIKLLIDVIGTKHSRYYQKTIEYQHKEKSYEKLYKETSELRDENMKLTHMLILEQLKNNKYFEVIQKDREIIQKYEIKYGAEVNDK